MINADFFDSFLEGFTDTGGSVFETLFSWISSFFSFVLSLFLNLFSESSAIGKYVVDFFDDIVANGLSVDVIYVFLGAIVVVFIFRLLWDLIP